MNKQEAMEIISLSQRYPIESGKHNPYEPEYYEAQGFLEASTHYEAELSRYRSALESIAKNTCCDKCQEAALVAKSALKGEGKP